MCLSRAHIILLSFVNTLCLKCGTLLPQRTVLMMHSLVLKPP